MADPLDDFAMMDDYVREPHPVVMRIDQALHLNHEADEPEPRGYLGASICGKLCGRALWYDFRHASGRLAFPPFILRRFDTGHLYEQRVCDWLRLAGYDVIQVDDDGHQYRCAAVDGFFGGHVDGFVRGPGLGDGKTWWLLEAKSMVQAKYVRDADGNPTRNKTKNTTEGRWFRVRRQGVMKAELTHYCQMQAYMHLSREEPALSTWPAVVDHCLYVAVGTDTEHLYVEEVPYRAGHGHRIMTRAERIIRAEVPPERISDNPASWDCRYCDHLEICHGPKPMSASCRTCGHVEQRDGEWHCTLHDRPSPRLCDDFRAIEEDPF